jgi:penicillin-binding protein 2
MSDYEASEEEVRDLQPRFRVIYSAILITFLILFSRLWFLQIIEGDELREYSEKNRVKENRIAAPRGLVLDRNGQILVDNITGYDASIVPQYASELEQTAVAVSRILNIDSNRIVEMVKSSRRKNGPFKPVVIKENLTFEDVFRLKRIQIEHPSLRVQETILRYYPLEENGAQLFGYVGEISKKQLTSYNKKNAGKATLQQGDIVGQSGLEEVLDLHLRGRDGLSFIEVDAHGRESPTENKAFLQLKPQPAISGSNVTLTIDLDIQTAAHKAMLQQKDKTGPRIGGLVAMKTNGEILAWVNTPSFNPNKFARGISSDLWSQLVNDPFRPLRNKVIQDHYAPGSTLKPVVAVAALQEGIITPSTIVSAPGQMRFGNRTYHDSLKQGHGDINVYRAIESSSNIFFFKMGIQLGIDNIAKYAKAMGLGRATGIELNNEVPGVFPTKEWKLKAIGEVWQPGENLSNAIGQGFVLTNLLQMTLAYNTIATGGKLYRPLLIKDIFDEEGKTVKSNSPQVVYDLSNPSSEVRVDPKYLEVVSEAMRRVANGSHGTARWWRISGIEMAGKTGTSQVRSFAADDIYTKCETRPVHLRHHGSYIAYAPAKDPEIIVGVLAEHSCHGNTGATPIVRDVIRAYFEKYRPELLKGKSAVKVEGTPTVVDDEIGETTE